jgi:uncharacterized membrane protein (DUF485 family)
MAQEHDDSPPAIDHSDRNKRTGLLLFVVYLAMYGGFMAWNVISPSSMATPVLLGMNLAIVYGFGLIIAALGLAIAYAILANRGQRGQAQ